jgi:hypothetical protein
VRRHVGPNFWAFNPETSFGLSFGLIFGYEIKSGEFRSGSETDVWPRTIQASHSMFRFCPRWANVSMNQLSSRRFSRRRVVKRRSVIWP